MLGWEGQLNWFWEKISKRFDCKHRGRIGPGAGDVKSIRVLNRVVTWGDEGIEYEPDQRHAELIIRDMGLEGSSRAVSTPYVKEEILESVNH